MQKMKLKVIAFLWLIWTIDAAYLTNEAYKLKEKTQAFWNFWSEQMWMICDVSSTFSCSSVFKEDFAWIFWVPFSGIALVVYPIILLIALLWLKWKIKNPFKILLAMWIWGLAFNGYIIYHEYLVSTYCLLCLLCTLIISTILWISIAWLKNKNEK